MPHQIDNLDREIVRLLMEDGRMSSAEMARRTGRTERVVRYRMDRLIQEGVIRVSAIANPAKLGLSVMADVWIEAEPGKVMTIAKELTQFEQVGYVACSTGDHDISIQVLACSVEDVYRFSTEVLGNVPGIRKTSTLIVPLILKDIYDWQIPDCADDVSERSGA